MRKLPKATIINQVHGVKTLWRIDWPSTPFKWGKSYYATTYPGSEHIFLETAAKRRIVAPGVAAKIVAQVKDAIARAQKK